MSKKTDALKKVAVALGYGSAVSEYVGNTVADVLKEIAVKMSCASSVAEIRANGITEVLNYIANNYGSEEKEPYNLARTATHATVTVTRNGKAVTDGADKLYNGDKLTITATGDTGYDVTTLTVNGTVIESDDIFTVNGHNVAIVATGTLKTFDLDRTATDCTITVTKSGVSVSDGEDVLTYGDEITITATTEEGYTLSSLKVNGKDFVSGETLTVTEEVAIIGVAEAD